MRIVCCRESHGAFERGLGRGPKALSCHGNRAAAGSGNDHDRSHPANPCGQNRDPDGHSNPDQDHGGREGGHLEDPESRDPDHDHGPAGPDPGHGNHHRGRNLGPSQRNGIGEGDQSKPWDREGARDPEAVESHHPSHEDPKEVDGHRSAGGNGPGN